MTVQLLRSQPHAARRLWPILALILVSFLAAQTGFADTSRRERRESKSSLGGFSPYFSTGPYTTIQRVRASIDTDFGVSERKANTLTNLGWLFELGVRSPRLEKLPGQPCFDLAGGFLIPMNTSSTIGSSVSITEGQFNDTLKEETKLGLDYGTSYRAGLGIEFLIEVLPVDLQITPGVQYLYLDSRYIGEVDSTRSFISEAPSITRQAQAKANLVQHFVGPSLRVATEPVELWGLQVDLFLEGALLIDVAGTRESRTTRDEENRRASFNWEAGSSAGMATAGFRILLP
jgi:hypothetical protein